MTPIHDAVRSWAQGAYTLEVGVELLIAHDAIYDGAPWLIDLHGKEHAAHEFLPPRVMVDVDELLHHSGAWSGGKQRVVAIAASLLSPEHPVNLDDALPGLDRNGLELVLAAVAHASGSHEHSGRVTDDHGRTVGFERLSSLYPWPTPSTPTSLGVPLGATPPGTGHGPGL